jgi:hypothetical protein
MHYTSLIHWNIKTSPAQAEVVLGQRSICLASEVVRLDFIPIQLTLRHCPKNNFATALLSNASETGSSKIFRDPRKKRQHVVFIENYIIIQYMDT